MKFSTIQIRLWSRDQLVTNPRIALEMCDRIDYLEDENKKLKDQIEKSKVNASSYIKSLFYRQKI